MAKIRYIEGMMPDPAPRPAAARRSARAATLGLAASLLVAGGCGDPLPSSQRIASTRVLAMKSEVIAPLLPEPDPDAAVQSDRHLRPPG